MFLSVLVAHALAPLSFPTRRSSDLAGCDQGERWQRRAAAAGGGLLPRDVEAEPGGAGVFAEARAQQRRDDRALPTRLREDRKSTRLNSSHLVISYAVFCLKKKKDTH